MGTDFSIETPANDNPFAPGGSKPTLQQSQDQSFGVLRSSDADLPPVPRTDGERYYTIQRVNGNGANGKGDGMAGGHKHTLEESDRVKKSTIHRRFLKEEKERKKSLVSNHLISTNRFVPAQDPLRRSASCTRGRVIAKIEHLRRQWHRASTLL